MQKGPEATLGFSSVGYRAGDAAPMAYIELVDRPRVEEDDVDDEDQDQD